MCAPCICAYSCTHIRIRSLTLSACLCARACVLYVLGLCVLTVRVTVRVNAAHTDKHARTHAHSPVHTLTLTLTCAGEEERASARERE